MYYMFLTLAVMVVVITITEGIIKLNNGGNTEKSKLKKALKTNLYTVLPVVTGLIISAIPQVAHAAGTTDSGSGLGFLAAGLSTGLSAIAAGYAVGATGSSALGAISEDPKLLGKTLIIVGLAEGIAIYGFIISIMIIGRL